MRFEFTILFFSSHLLMFLYRFLIQFKEETIQYTGRQLKIMRIWYLVFYNLFFLFSPIVIKIQGMEWNQYFSALIFITQFLGAFHWSAIFTEYFMQTGRIVFAFRQMPILTGKARGWDLIEFFKKQDVVFYQPGAIPIGPCLPYLKLFHALHANTVYVIIGS